MAGTYSEEEARKKWCPFARARDGVGTVAVNRMETSLTEDGSVADPDCMCLASGCMAWRKKMQDGSGFCGLAGQGWA